MKQKDLTLPWYEQMNQWGQAHKPFVFVLDFLLEKPLFFPLPVSGGVFYQMGAHASSLPDYQPATDEYFRVFPIDYATYKRGFRQVMEALLYGDSFLLNFTQPSRVETAFSLEEIFCRAQAPYKLLLPGEFVVFSPEIFVRIDSDGFIRSFPMKGTIDAGLPGAEQIILRDEKERAEHFTIVDLIRNDLASVAEQVEVVRLRYIDRVEARNRTLLQVSSEISGRVGRNYSERLGDIFRSLLPAGSISGAPKPRTLEEGRILRSELHDARIARTQKHFYGSYLLPPLSELIAPPEYALSGLWKVRVDYGRELGPVSFSRYVPRVVNRLYVVRAPDADYGFKYVNRVKLEQLRAVVAASAGFSPSSGEQDWDILIVRNGCLTDSSYANILLRYPDGSWVTPDTPLLRGTMREWLLQQGVIREARIFEQDLAVADGFMLVNAMLPFDEHRIIREVIIFA